MKKCKYLFLFIISLFIIIPKNVNAETMQYNFCFGDKGAYSVSYDSNIATEVTKEKIDYEAVKNGHVAYPNNATTIADSEKAKYAINATRISSKCTNNSDGTIQICPTNKSALNFSNIVNYYLNNEIQIIENSSQLNSKTYVNDNKNILVELNETTGKVKIYIRKYKFKESNNKTKKYELSLRPIYNDNDFNKDDSDASKYQNEFLKSSGDFYILDGVNFMQKLTFEIYEKDSSKCNGTYLGDISFIVPDSSDFTIKNPAKNSKTEVYKVCQNFKKYYPSGLTDTEDKSAFDEIKKSYVNECYDERIKYNELSQLENNINEKITLLKSKFENFGLSSNSSSTSYCTDVLNLSKGMTRVESNEYWYFVCNDTYTAQGDSAKLVRAGEGFDYVSNFKVVRTCQIFQKKKVKKKAKCEYTTNHTCTWNTKSGTGEGSDAGPSEYFDACINLCDGGNYTQECINKCYKSSYSNDRNISLNTEDILSTNNNSRNNIKKISTTSTTKSSPLSGESCTTDHGRPGFYLYHTWTPGNGNTYTDRACFSDYCSTHGGQCTFYLNKTPDGCVDNPSIGYQTDLLTSQSNYEDLYKLYDDPISTGDYTIEIVDSFLKNGESRYVFTVNSNDPAISVTSSQSTSYGPKSSITLGEDPAENRTIQYVSTATTPKNITVKLPLSYVNKITGGAVYKSDETSKNNAYEIYQTENKVRKLRKVQQEGTAPTSDAHPITEFVASNYYHQEGERKYYTSIWSQSINILISENRVSLKPLDDVKTDGNLNIQVISSNVGKISETKLGFSSNIQCYYGVYNSYYCDNKDDCPVPECKENCPDPTGIQYIYRVIDLTDVFPNDRNPRWNWTSSAARKASETRIGYNIDPIAKTKDIESKGESIYTDQSETDYEFYLTRENIRNIRDYNKHVKDYNNDGSNNYLDYNMSCYIDAKGRQICTSRFLDNINGNSGSEESSNYITYGSQFTIDSRKALAGCNDAIGQSCNDKYN